MIHSGRHRYKTHAGIPHGSTNNLAGDELSFYYQWKEGCAVAQWDDQSPNNRHATQGTSGNQAEIAADGSLDLELDNADHYDFTEVAIVDEEDFVIWVVFDLETSSANSTIFGMGTAAHFLELKGGGDTVRIKLANSNTEIAPGDGTNNDFASSAGKMVVTIHREGGGTGNLILYKNGVLLAQDSQANNSKDAEFTMIGVRSGDRYFDGKIYDMAFVQQGGAPAAHISRINTYLCAKHGISETL